MKFSTTAVTLLASLLSLSAHAIPIPVDKESDSLTPAALELAGSLEQFEQSVSPLDVSHESVTPIEVTIDVGGYRFSHFVAFHSVSQVCEIDGSVSGRGSCSTNDSPRSVPEPGSLLLLSTGLLLLFVASQGRRQRTVPA